jgi:hypothetical protein
MLPLDETTQTCGEAMATDKTAFDDFLKTKLHRDIGFRIVVWASISGLTASTPVAIRALLPLRTCRKSPTH